MRMEVWHQRSEQSPQLVIPMLFLGGSNYGFDSAHHTVGENPVPRAKDFRVISRQHVLGAEEHLLVELLARTHAREFDLNVGADGQTGEANQIGGDVDDADRLAHVEQKYFAAAPERACL